MEHLALEIFDLPTTADKNPTTSKFATMEEDASITITDTSEIFASGDVWSYSFRLNARANAHILGSVADLHGSRLHDILDRRRARLWVEDIAIYLGYIRLADEAEVDSDGNIDVTFESGQKTFEDMIEGAKANQVPMMDDVLIGLALFRKRWTTCTVSMQTYAVFKNGKNSSSADVFYAVDPHTGTIGRWLPLAADGEEDAESAQEYPRYIFPKLPAGTFEDLTDEGLTEIDCLNTDYPYDDEHPYCNVALCYQRQGYERKHEDGSVWDDYSQEPEAQRGYEVMPANRVNSAPNFYVIYWIRALMKHLGIFIEENQMMDVEDLRRLFFVNTNCAHKEPDKLRTVTPDPKFGKLRFTLSGRNIARMIPEYFGAQETEEDEHGYTTTSYRRGDSVDAAQSKLTCKDYEVSETTPLYDEFGGIDHVVVNVEDIKNWTDSEREQYEQKNGFLYKAYASSECFPNVEISEAIKAIEDGFGIRFLFSDDYKRVRIVLLRNVFNDSEIQDIACDIVEESKEESCVRGFRMTYGNTEDTQFYYKGFNDKLPHKKPYFVDDSDKHDYSHWNLDADYGDLIQKISAFDKTCSVTPVNGNAYVIKVDKDAKRYDQLHPSLFECAGFMDAEDGDCSGEEETIHEISLGFSPAIMNDVNFENEKGGNRERKQIFALFVDEGMRPRRPDLKGEDSPYNNSDAEYPIYGKTALYGEDSPAAEMKADGIVKPGEFAIMSDLYTKVEGKKLSARLTYGLVPVRLCDIAFDIEGAVYEGYRLYLQDNYEPNDNGISPVETKDWGLTLGIMRGSGSDAYVSYGADPDDHEDNDTWEKVPGSSVTSHPDTCDSYGNEWDYNGEIHVSTAAEAEAAIDTLYPDSNVEFFIPGPTNGYVNGASITTITDDQKVEHNILIATHRGSYSINFGQDYIKSWIGHSVEEIMEMDADDKKIIIEMDSSRERGDTILELCRIAYGGSSETMVIDNGVGSRYGRFSLKLRAQKPNPYFDPKQEEGPDNQRYLTIDNENLRQRGLIDAFYKEYSYWMRNARVCKRTVRMTLADLLKIDKTKKVKVGDITGFVRKIQYSVSKKTGLGMVTFEIMYI